jgi:hypothetical protein
MKISRHAEVSLVAMTGSLPVPASAIIERLSKTPAPEGRVALEVCRMTIPRGTPEGTNGDSVVVIIRDGIVVTAMLRRSWNQRFDPEALRVDRVLSWHEEKAA